MQLKACGLLIVRRLPQPTFLLMRHADRWDLPKGHAEPGESELQCALRETVEETGLPAECLDVRPGFRFEHRYRMQTSRSPSGEAEKTLVVFLARLWKGNESPPLQLSEHIGYRWFPWNPPHQIQQQTIDPLLHYAERHAPREFWTDAD